MSTNNQESWSSIIEPSDLHARVLISLLQILREKEVITDEDLRRLADHSCQQLVSEEEARRRWHTPWLPTEELAAKVHVTSETVILDAGSGFGGPARELA